MSAFLDSQRDNYFFKKNVDAKHTDQAKDCYV